MTRHAIQQLIEQADATIDQEDFDTLIEFYSDDAVLVVKPGTDARGTDEIRRAFELVAAHFNHRLEVHQAGLKILESGDTALVLARTIVAAPGVDTVTRAAIAAAAPRSVPAPATARAARRRAGAPWASAGGMSRAHGDDHAPGRPLTPAACNPAA